MFPLLYWPWGVPGERVDIMTGSGGKVLSAYVEEVSPMRTHLRDDSWRPYVIPNKVRSAGVPCMLPCSRRPAPKQASSTTTLSWAI